MYSSEVDVVTNFEVFLSSHLRDFPDVLESCTTKPSLSTYFFAVRKTRARCNSLTDVLDSKWPEKLKIALMGKFVDLDVENMQKALREFASIEDDEVAEFEDNDSLETSNIATTSNDDTGEQFVSTEKFHETIACIMTRIDKNGNKLDHQKKDQANLRFSVSRLTNCANSSLAANAAVKQSLLGIWLPQLDQGRLEGQWENALQPSRQWKDRDDRPRSEEEMWFVFDSEINDAGRRSGGNDLALLYKLVFGQVDANEMFKLDKHHPRKVAMDQLNLLVSNAKASTNLTLQAAEIANHQRKVNPQCSFDENSFIQSKLEKQLETEKRIIRHRSNRYFQNKRERKKAQENRRGMEDRIKNLTELLDQQIRENEKLMSEKEYQQEQSNPERKSPKRNRSSDSLF